MSEGKKKSDQEKKREKTQTEKDVRISWQKDDRCSFKIIVVFSGDYLKLFSRRRMRKKRSKKNWSESSERVQREFKRDSQSCEL